MFFFKLHTHQYCSSTRIYSSWARVVPVLFSGIFPEPSKIPSTRGRCSVVAVKEMMKYQGVSLNPLSKSNKAGFGEGRIKSLGLAAAN